MATEGVLLGGLRYFRSSRFATEDSARRWLWAIKQTNGKNGRSCEGRVYPSTKAPEIEE